MTLATDVVRITAKDLRVLRWPLLGWSVLLLMSVLRGLGLTGGLEDVLFPVTVLVPALATVLVALAVATDPAVPGPTFWGVHRHRPVAVAGAKAGFALLLLVLMAAGHAVVLTSHDIRPNHLAALVLEAARETGAWLLFAAALGAGMRDAKGWVTGASAVAVGCVVLAQVLGDPASWRSAWPLGRGEASLLLLSASLGVLQWAYRSEIAGVRAWVRTAVLTLAAALALVTPGDTLATGRTRVTPVRDTALVVDSAHATARLDGRTVVVDIPVTHPDSSRVVGATVAWELHLDDGHVVHPQPGGARVRRTAALERMPEALERWGRGAITRTLSFRYPLDSATIARVAGKVVQVVVVLETDRLAMRPVASFPVQTGGVFAFDGRRMRVGPRAPDGRFSASISRIWRTATPSATPLTVGFAAEPVLVHREPGRGVGTVLVGHAAAGDAAPSWVLPGNAMQAWAGMLEAPGAPAARAGDVIVLAAEYAGRVDTGVRIPVVR